jgi:hypothetical protein
MDADAVMEHLGRGYPSFLRPDTFDPENVQAVQRLRRVASTIDDDTVSRLINGQSWRERLVGLYLAAMRGADRFSASIIQSLRDPRGLAIVPACAAISIALRHQRATDWEKPLGELDVGAFSGELCWGLAKLRWALKWADMDPGDLSSNDGMDVEEHVRFYEEARLE